MRILPDMFQKYWDIFRTDSLSMHASVDFEMYTNRFPYFSEFMERIYVVYCQSDSPEIHVWKILRERIPYEEHSRIGYFPDFERFIVTVDHDVAWRAGREDPCHLLDAVPIGIGFEYREDIPVRMERLEYVKIIKNRSSRYLYRIKRGECFPERSYPRKKGVNFEHNRWLII